jgi:hypothetical protein
MKVRILKPWLCGGRLPQVGKTVDLPEETARSGIERGLCTAVKQTRRSMAARTRTEKRKSS